MVDKTNPTFSSLNQQDEKKGLYLIPNLAILLWYYSCWSIPTDVNHVLYVESFNGPKQTVSRPILPATILRNDCHSDCDSSSSVIEDGDSGDIILSSFRKLLPFNLKLALRTVGWGWFSGWRWSSLYIPSSLKVDWTNVSLFTRFTFILWSLWLSSTLYNKIHISWAKKKADMSITIKGKLVNTPKKSYKNEIKKNLI